MNDTKHMISDRAAASTKLPSTARKATLMVPKEISAKIRNLPGAGFILTRKILRTNVCRICATYYQSGPDLFPLYVSFAGTKLSQIANALLPIKVQQNEEMPEYICRACTNMLTSWRDMRESAAEAARILRTHADIQAGVTNTIPPVSSSDSNTLHFVDLMDSSDDEEPEPVRAAAPAAPRAGVGTPPPSDGEAVDGGEIVSRYVLGSWAV